MIKSHYELTGQRIKPTHFIEVWKSNLRENVVFNSEVHKIEFFVIFTEPNNFETAAVFLIKFKTEQNE